MIAKRQAYAVAAVLSMLSVCLVHAVPVRLAVVWKQQQLDGLGMMLAARLSESKDCDLVERQELRKLLDEQRLSLLTSGERHFVLKAGELVGCDLFVCFEVVGDPPFQETLMRVFHGRSGARLASAALPRTDDFEARLKRCVEVAKSAIAKERRGDKLVGVSLISRTDKGVPADIRHIPALAARLVEWGLANSRRCSVLERRHLEWSSKERDLTGAENTLAPSSLIVTFSVRKSGKQAVLGVTTRRSDGQEAGHDFPLTLPLDYAGIAPVLKSLGEEVDTGDAAGFDAGIESVAFFHKALFRRDNANWSGALRSAEAAYALNPRELAMMRLLRTSLLAEACAVLSSDTDVAHGYVPWAIESDEESLGVAISHAERAYDLWQHLLRFEPKLRKESRFPYLESYLDRQTTLPQFLRVAANVSKGWTPSLRKRFAVLQRSYRAYVMGTILPDLQQRLLHKPGMLVALGELRTLFAKEIPAWAGDVDIWFRDYSLLSDIWRNNAEALSAAEFRLAHPGYRPGAVLEFLLPGSNGRRLELPRKKLIDHFDRWGASQCPFMSSLGVAVMLRLKFDTLDIKNLDARRAYERSLHQLAGSAYLEIGRPKKCPFWQTPAQGKQLFYGLMYHAQLLEARVAEQHLRAQNLAGAELLEKIAKAKTQAAHDLLERMRQRGEFAPVVRQLLLNLSTDARRLLLKDLSALLADPKIKFCGSQGERDRLCYWLKQRKTEVGLGSAPVPWQEKTLLYRPSDMLLGAGDWPYCLHKDRLIFVPPRGAPAPVEANLQTGKCTGLQRRGKPLTGNCVGVAVHGDDVLVITQNDGLHAIADGRSRKIDLPRDCRNIEAFCVAGDVAYLKCGLNPEQVLHENGIGGSRIVAYDLKEKTASVLADSRRVKRQSPFDGQAAFSVPWMMDSGERLFFAVTYNILQHGSSKDAAPGLWAYDPRKKEFQLIRRLRFGGSASHHFLQGDGRLLVQSHGRLDAFDPLTSKWQAVAARYGIEEECFTVSDLFRGVQLLDHGRLFLHADEDRRTLQVLLPGKGGAVQLEPFTRSPDETIERLLPAGDRLIAFTSNGVYRLRLDDVKLATWLQHHRISITKQPAEVHSGEPFNITVYVPPGTTELHWWDRSESGWQRCGRVRLTGKSPHTVQIGPLKSEYMRRLQLGITACRHARPVASTILPPILVRSLDFRRLRRLGEHCEIVVADLGEGDCLSNLFKAAGVPHTHIDDPSMLVGHHSPGILIDGRWMDEYESSALPYLRYVVKQRKNIVIYGPCSYNPFLLSARGFSIPGAIRQLSPADRSHFFAHGGRWPDSWWREVETGVFQWQPGHGNLHPLLDDKLGRHVIIETYPQIGGRALTVQLPIVGDLGHHDWAEKLLVRIVNYAGRPWRPPVERAWRGMELLATHAKVTELANSLHPRRDSKSRVAIVDARAELTRKELKRLQKGAILVMPVPYRGKRTNTQRNADICDGFSAAWVSRVSSFVPLNQERWDATPVKGYREELIPGMLARIYSGYGQLLIVSIPPTADRTRMAQEHLAILLTNLRVRLGEKAE